MASAASIAQHQSAVLSISERKYVSRDDIDDDVGSNDSDNVGFKRRGSVARASIYAAISAITEGDDNEISGSGSAAPPDKEEEGGEKSRGSRQFQDSSRARIPANAKCIINPKSKFQARWDVVMMLLLIYTAIVTPFEVGFLEPEMGSLFVINRLVDLLFVQDLVMQFMTPYYNNESGGWEINHSKIAKQYLTGWFSIDLASILPFDTIGLVLQSDEVSQLKILRVVRLFRLAKLLRIFRSSRLVKRYQAQIGISYASQTMYKFGIMIIMVAHWLACAWGVIQSVEEAYEYGAPKNWISAYGLWEERVNNPFRVYLAALYWATMTVTTIGYGDITPNTEGEQILCVAAMLLGASTYAYVIGSVCGVIALMDQATSKYHQQMDELNQYMAENHMPAKLRIRLREYFQYCKQLNRQRYYQTLLTEMSPALRGEVAYFINSAWLDQVPFFNPRGLGEQEKQIFCTEISMKLRPEAYAPQEIVIKRGEPTHKFYLLQRGVMARGGRIIGSGSYVGDDFVLHSQKREYCVRAITYIDVFSLERSSLEDVLNTNDLPTIGPRVRLFAIQLAFRKAFVKFGAGKLELKDRRTSRYSDMARPEQRLHQGVPETSMETRNSIVEQAQREINASQQVQSPTSALRRVAAAEPRSPSESPVHKSRSSPKIATAAAGSASKVLQLMAERHEKSMSSIGRVVEGVNRVHETLNHKVGTLVGELAAQRKEFNRFAVGLIIITSVLGVLNIVILVVSSRS